MKKHTFYVATLFASLLLVSCGKPKPDNVALEFYQNIINNDIAKAKEYCLPSAIEEIERLEKIDVYKNNVNKEPMQLMEVVIKNPNYADGDTAIVNYKINNFKSFLTLIMKDGKWNIAYSYELRYLTTLEFEATEFFEQLNNNKGVFWRKYEGIFFMIKNLAMISAKSGIPYSKEKNMIYVKNAKKEAYDTKVREYYKIFGKEVNYNNELKLGQWDSSSAVSFYLEDLNDEERAKFQPAEVLSKSNIVEGNYSDDSYNVKSIIDFKGCFSSWDIRIPISIKFDNCSIIHVTNN